MVSRAFAPASRYSSVTALPLSTVKPLGYLDQSLGRTLAPVLDRREELAMRRAIALAALGLGTTSPNPPVGCVVLDADGRVVGEGYHVRKGEPHAEVQALAAAGDRAKGGIACVTLEPCNHYGRTPPCHQALIDAGVTRVVVALLDPTSRNEGSIGLLRAAGIDVEVEVLASEAQLVLAPWLTGVRSKRPRVTWVQRLPPAESATLVDERPLAGLRSGFDAVLTDRGIEEGRPGAHGAQVFSVAGAERVAAPEVLLSSLYEGGVRQLLIDAPARAASPLLEVGCVDEIWVWFDSAPSADPGLSSPPWLLVPPGFELRQVRKVDGFALIEAVRSDETLVE